MKITCLLLSISLLSRVAFAAGTEDFSGEIQRLESSAKVAGPDSPDYRKYAPSREADILHVALDVTPDFTNRTVAGKTVITFKPIARPLEQLRLDAVDLTINAVTSSESLLGYELEGDKIVVTFAAPVPVDKEAWVAIEHRAEPKKGLYFRTPELGYKAGDTHLFTQGEAIEARHWYPCFDSPNEKFTSEITCRVPGGMTVLSNGRLISETKDPVTGLIAVKWSQEKPHTTYLMSLLAGFFKKIEDQYKDVPLAFYTPASEINQAGNSFRDTKDIMGFFEEATGTPFPWAKYYQVAVNDFVAGGMENTSITTLTDGTLFTDATENIRTSQGLVAHEMAHQWFGDLVTCKDWSHIWLNEGFATYYAALYDEHKNGHGSFIYTLYGLARNNLTTNSPRSIVDRKFDAPMDMFGYLAYQKGAWVLHMLRSRLGEELYRQCIKTYLERHQFGSVVTEDLNAVIEELSGRSYDRFFDQWVFHGGYPELDVTYHWDARNKLARVSIRQTQKVSEDISLFQFPLTIRFKTGSSSVDKRIEVKEKSEDFYFSLPEAPAIVRIDPEYTLLARVSFLPPTPMLFAQLEDQTDDAGRLLAVETLSKRQDKETVEKLKRALNSDTLYGVRFEAVAALKAIHTDEALDALIASTKQPDARVRRQVYSGIAGFYHSRAADAGRQILAGEKNPDIQAVAIRELGTYPKPETRAALLGYLNSNSYRNSVADAAIAAIRAQADPSWIEPLEKNLKDREADYTSGGLGQGLNAVAYLAREEKDKSTAREFLVGYVNHPKKSVQLAALNALGILGDAGALPVLEKFALARRESREQLAATRALQAIENFRRSAESLGDLRKEFLDLQKQNQELRKDFNTLEKKVNALPPAPDGKGLAPAKVKSPKDGTAR